MNLKILYATDTTMTVLGMVTVLVLAMALVLIGLFAAPAAAPAAPADADPLPPLLRLWPAGVRVPPGLVPYERTRYAQRLVILNGHDDLRLHPTDQADLGTPNPNQKPEWRTNGGLSHAAGIESYTGVALPAGESVRYWTQRVEAGARRPLPRYFWQFPEGTRFVDLLTESGRPFELRMLKKEGAAWHGHVVWESEHKPTGYQPLRGKCSDCHQFAGGSYGYGVILRGSDGVFSWSPFAGAELRLRADFPLKPWGEQ